MVSSLSFLFSIFLAHQYQDSAGKPLIMGMRHLLSCISLSERKHHNISGVLNVTETESDLWNQNKNTSRTSIAR
jgi:hypothetical protein